MSSIRRSRELDERAVARLQEIESAADLRFETTSLELGEASTLSERELRSAAGEGLLWVASAAKERETELADAGDPADLASRADLADLEPAAEADQSRELHWSSEWVGFACARALGSHTSERDRPLELRQISVEPAMGGRGLGAELLHAVLAEADRRAVSVFLRTFRDVPWNAPWYRRFGFVEVTGEEAVAELSSEIERERAAGLAPELRVTMRRFPRK